MNDPHFLVDQSVVLPLNVPTLGTTQIGIWFHPEEGIPYNGILTITSNAVGQPTVDVALEGAGVNTVYPVGTLLWSYMINGGYDNSPKAIGPIQDITGDGVDDVIVCSEDNNVRCFNGNASVQGDVLWAKEIYSGSVYSQNGLATIDDINNDGYRDVIVGTAWGDRSIVALSGKTGLQLWKHDTHEYGDGGWVYQVDVRYDYNDDGFPDVLASTGDDGNDTGPVRVYCLNGKTGVPIWKYYAGGPVFSVIGVEDFTGDGKPDVIAGASNSLETIGKVYGLDGIDGTHIWTYSTSGSSVWGLMQIDDINNDGIKDVAAGDFSGNILFLNASSGSKIFNMSIGNVLILRLQNMGDVNYDGHPDILVGHSGTNGIIIDGMTCQTIWSKPLADQSWCVANIHDITWDGTNDAIIGTLFQNNRAYFMDGTDGTIIKSLPVPAAVDALNAIPDIVGDSTMEMVLGDRDGLVRCLSGGYDTTSTTGIPPVYLPDERISVKIFPNPSDGIFKVQVICRDKENLSFRLTDLQGRSTEELLTKQFSSGIHEITFDVTTIRSAGVYILEVIHDKGSIRKKIILTDQ
jgi:outer membrane protein assembly factor BamB